MTNDEMRMAIAEACGYDLGLMRVCHCGDAEKNHTWEHGFVPMPCLSDLPNYPADLNAMHEAEKALTDEQHSLFRIVLMDLSNLDFRGQVSATAAQRAEAFLRAIGKWKEAKQ